MIAVFRSLVASWSKSVQKTLNELKILSSTNNGQWVLCKETGLAEKMTLAFFTRLRPFIFFLNLENCLFVLVVV